MQALQHLANGLTQREAAKRIGVSMSTMRTHLGNVHNRLCTTSPAHAVAEAMRRNLIK